jgi:hypothetical protein
VFFLLYIVGEESVFVVELLLLSLFLFADKKSMQNFKSENLKRGEAWEPRYR